MLSSIFTESSKSFKKAAKRNLQNENRVDSFNSPDAQEQQQNSADVEPAHHNLGEIDPNSDYGNPASDQLSDSDQSAHFHEFSLCCDSAESMTTSETDDEAETEAAGHIDGNTDDEVERVFLDNGSEVDDEILNNEIINDQENDDAPLYDGARLSVSESLITILNFSLWCNMTGIQLTEALRIIELHCPRNNKCVATLHKFKKHFSISNTPLVRHFYFPGCTQRLGNKDSICTSCTEPSKSRYFIEVPIISQIKALYRREGFKDKVQYRHTTNRHNPNSYDDIYEGEVYTELNQNDGILADPRNISFTWYTDGISIYRSSKFSIWPLYLIINELPFDERTKKENIILAAMWFGEKKPIPHLLLVPLDPSIMELRQGIDVNIPNTEIPLHVRGIIICGTCDFPAEALFLNMNQYNGIFGCQKCKIQGKYLPERRVRVYPYEHFNLRTE